MQIIKKLYVIIAIVSGCSLDNQQTDLSSVDVRGNFPEKEILLTDIADVTYLCLNSDNNDYLFKGYIRDITRNTIVVADDRSGDILFFTSDGNPKSRFNHKGNGPEEYIRPTSVIYDEESDDVFVYSFASDIQVYSSRGAYKRKIDLPEGTIASPIVSFDEKSLFVYDASIQMVSGRKRDVIEETDYPVRNYNSPFVRISKADGKVLDYVELPINNIILSESGDQPGPRILTYRLVKCEKGLLLCNPETDTVYLYNKEKSLVPLICKTPSVGSLDPMIILNNCVDADKYQFMEIGTAKYMPDESPTFPVKYVMRDKKTGEVFRQKIIIQDYKEKNFFISPRTSGRNYDGYFHFELDLVELKQAYNENKLSGKLKELVARLDEDVDNNVLMLVKFK